MSGSKCTLWTPRVTFLPTWRSPNLIRRVNTTWWFHWRILMPDGPGSQPEKPNVSRTFQNPIWCNQRHRRQRTHEGQRSCGCRSNMVQAGLEVPGTFQQDLGLVFQCGAIRPLHLASICPSPYMPWIIKYLFCLWRIKDKPCTLTLGG